MCCYPPSSAFSQPSCRAINILIEEAWFCLRREERKEEINTGISLSANTQVETRQQQHKANMSAENYLMQEELGSTF